MADEVFFMLYCLCGCILILLGIMICTLMEIKLLRTEVNDYIYYTYQPCDCFTHKDYYPYMEHESVGDCDAVSVPSA